VVKITQDPTTAEYDDLPRTKWSHDALHEISDTKFAKITSNETQIEHDLGNIFHSVTGPFPSFTEAKEYANRYLGPVSRNANNDDTSFWGEVPANIRNVQDVMDSLVKEPVASYKSGRYPSMTFEDALRCP
jgi:hypothetical protein